MRWFIAGLLSCLFTFEAVSEPISVEEGQTWTFKDAPHPDVRIVIGKIEQIWDGKDIAVSVSIVNLRTERGNLIGQTISHLPFSREALQPHLVELNEVSLPLDSEFEGGYATWKAALERGEAGVFTISPAEAIIVVLDTVWEAE